jgi:hypothetical protein
VAVDDRVSGDLAESNDLARLGLMTNAAWDASALCIVEPPTAHGVDGKANGTQISMSMGAMGGSMMQPNAGTSGLAMAMQRPNVEAAVPVRCHAARRIFALTGQRPRRTVTIGARSAPELP